MKRRAVSWFVVVSLIYNPGIPCFANPSGGTVVGGDRNGTIGGAGTGVTTINQHGHRIIINWQDFSIGSGEVTRFVQPSASSWALNRIISGNPSLIYGSLQANGHVLVLNPNGILVGAQGKIDTKGFYASTLDLKDSTFMKGGTLTLSGNSTASVRNEGTINALGGDVFLIANNVENSGTISAPQGTVGLAAGSTVRLVPAGNERISVLAGNANGAAANGVHNVGTVEGASAELKAAGGNIYALAINNEGVIRANSVVNEGGHVYLRASGGNIQNSGTISAHNADGSGGTVIVDGGHNKDNASTVINSGTIEARGDAAGTQGGKVVMTGDHVGLFDHAVVDVSGDSGGGTALIGGDYHGSNPNIQNADRTFVSEDAIVRADGLTLGDGGKVVIWSDGITRFNGTISAQGGALGGNGGSVETSSGNSLLYNGYVTTLAAAGHGGSLLLDPKNIFITTAGADPVTANDQFGENPTADANLSVANVIAALAANASLTLQANNDIAIEANLDFTANLSGTTAGKNFTLEAGRNIIFAQTPNFTTPSLSSGGVTVTMNGGNFSATYNDAGAQAANRDAGAAEFFMAPSSSILTLGGNINITGSTLVGAAGNATLTTLTTTGPANTTATPGGNITINTGTGGGDIIAGAVTTAGAVLTSGNVGGNSGGTVSLTGGNVTVSSIDSSGSNARGTGNHDAGSGGAVTIVASSGALNISGSVTTAGGDGVGSGNGGAGAAVNLTAASSASVNGITTSGGAGAPGGAGGAITIGAGTTLTSGGALASSGGNGLVSGNNAGIAGNIGLTAGGAATINSTITANGGAATGAGNGGAAGDVSITGASIGLSGSISAAGGSGSPAGASKTITLNATASGANQTAGSLSAANLLLTGVGAFDLSQSGNDVQTLAGNVNGNVTYSDANDLTVGTVGLTSGLEAGANSVALTVLGAGNRLTVNATATVHGGGGISLSADHMTLAGSTLDGGSSVVALRPQNGGAINLGTGSESGGALGLTAAELSTVHAGVLRIGDGSSGNLTIDGAIVPANTTTLSLQSGGSISQNSGDTITIANLAARAGTTINLSQANHVGTIATSSQGTTQYKDADGLTIGSVDGLDGASANNNSITITTVAGNLTVNDTAAANDVSAGSSSVNLNAGGANNLLTISAGAKVNGDAGVTLVADDMDLSGTVSTLGTALLKGDTALRQITLGTPGVGTLNLSGSEINNISADTLKIGDNSSGAITINGAIHPLNTPNLSLESSGPISEVAGGSLVVNGLTTVKSSGAGPLGNITLDQTGNDFSTVAIAVGNDVTLRDDNAIVLSGSTVSGNLAVTAGGNISETGALIVNGAGKTASFAVTAPGSDVLLGNQANNFSAVNVSGPVHNLALRNVNNNAAVPTLPSSLNDLTLIFDNAAITLPGVTLSGNLNVTAGGNITQTAGPGGAIIGNGAGQTATFTAGSHNIVLGNNNNDFNTVAINSANDVTLVDANRINLGASIISGNLNVSALNGPITQTGSLLVNGVGKTATFLSSGAGNDIILTDSGNDFTTILLSGNNANIHDVNGLNFGASSFSGNLFVTANGDISQSGALTFNPGGIASFNAGATHDITLGNLGNDFSTVAIVSGNNVTLQDANGIDFGASAISGNLDVTANGPISQSGAIIANGANATATFAAGAANNIFLDNPANDFTTVAVVSGHDVILQDANSIDLGPSTVSASFNVTARGDITESGPLNVTSGSSFFTIDTATGDVLLGSQGNDFGNQLVTISAVNGGSVRDVAFRNINAAAAFPTLPTTLQNLSVQFDAAPIVISSPFFLSGDLSLTANGPIGQTVAFTVNGSTTLTAGSGNDINLTAGNDFGGLVNIVSGDNVSLNDINALAVGGNVSGNLTTTAGGPIAFNAVAVGGNLIAIGNGLSDNGNVNITGTSGLNAGGGDISFTHADDFGGPVTIANANNVTLNDINNLTVGGSLGGTLAATAGGALVFNALTVGGNLTAAGNGLSDNGNVSITGTSALNAGGGDISFTHADDFGGAVTIANANNVTVNDINSLTVGGTVGANLSATAGGVLTFNTLSVGGNLTATGNGLGDNGNVNITGTSALNAGGGDIVFNEADNFGGAVTIANANNVTLNDINNLTVGGSVGGNLSTTAGGPLAFNALTVGGNLIATGDGLSDNANVSVTGTSTLNAGAGDISFTHADDFGGAVNIVSAHNATLNDNNNLTVGGTLSGNLIATAGTIAFNALNLGGNLTAAGIGLSDNGDVHITGTSTLEAGGGDVSFTHSDDFGGAVSIANAHNVTLNDINTIDLGASTMSGTLSVTAGGNITDSGNLLVTGDATFRTAGGNDIILDESGNTFNGAVTFAATSGTLHNVTVVDTTAFDINGLTVSGTFDVTSGGPVTQSGAINAPNLAVTTTSAGGNVTLNSSGNNVGTLAVNANGTVQFREAAGVKLTVGTVGGIDGIDSHGNDITLTADDLDIAQKIDAGKGVGDVLLQPVTIGRNIHFGDTDQANALNLSQTELDRISSRQLTIGSLTAGDVSGAHSQPPNVTVSPINILSAGARTDFDVVANQLSSLLAGAILPVPKLEVTTFSGAAIDASEAAKILPPGSIGTLFLQVPFIPVEAKKYRVEDVSKWTTGRIAAGGTTAGPQTPR